MFRRIIIPFGVAFLWLSFCIRDTDLALSRRIYYPQIQIQNTSIRDVKFLVYTKKRPKGKIFYANQTAKLINRYKMTKILIHGWQNDESSPMPQELKNSYLKYEDVNVVIVGWGKFAQTINYGFSVGLIPYVARSVAKFIFTNLKVDQPEIDVHLLGFSLGAHVCGIVGWIIQHNKRMVYRITGLDPAEPMIKRGLTAEDAYFVDTIHTSSGVLGQWDPVAHADFYPNGGLTPQPNCDLLSPQCSHSWSWKYYNYSIGGKKRYHAVRCNSFQNFLFGYCNGSAYMGEAASISARGTYYLTTKGESP